MTARKPVPPRWAELIDGYLASQAAIGRPATTRKLRREQLSQAAREICCAPADLTADRIVGWFAQQTWKIETRRSYRGTLRSFLEWGYKTGRLPVDLFDAVPAVSPPKPSARPASDLAWTTALLAANKRVTLMIRLAGEAGLRRAEVAQVHTRDLMESVDGPQLLVHGKGGKKRVVPISDGLAELIRPGAAGHTPGAPSSGWLFPNLDGGHLLPKQVGHLVSGVLPDGFTMHTLRHRFATRAYRGSRNLRAVQVLLGHESIATTERYTAVDDSEIRAAMTAAQS